jgi:hypothetical protein
MKKVMWEVLMKKQEETELLMSKEKHKWKKSLTWSVMLRGIKNGDDFYKLEPTKDQEY